MEDKVCLIVVNEFFMRYDFIFFPLIFTELVLIEYVHMNQTTYVKKIHWSKFNLISIQILWIKEDLNEWHRVHSNIRPSGPKGGRGEIAVLVHLFIALDKRCSYTWWIPKVTLPVRSRPKYYFDRECFDRSCSYLRQQSRALITAFLLILGPRFR
jgi:hypothetical protein